MKKILFIISMAIGAIYAQPCMTDIYFGNGVWNPDRDEIIYTQLKGLKTLMLNRASTKLNKDDSGKLFDWKIAYNPSRGTVDDLIETFYQLKESGQISGGYFFTIYSVLAAESNGEEFLQKLQTIISNYDGDVNTMYQLYTNASFNQKHNVLLVAHSQGNLFGNKMYTLMSEAQKKKFRMVSVATPADHVAGGGPYVTASGDYVINPIPGALPGNVDGVGHTFIGTYLKGSINAPRKIALYVKSAYDNLTQTETCTEYKYVKVLMPSFGQITIIGGLTDAYKDEIIGTTSLPIRDAYWDDVQERWKCGEPDTSYTTENGWGTNWALYNLYKITGGSYSFNRMEWTPGRIHNQSELDARSAVYEDMIMGTKCVTMSLEENKALYSALSDILSD